MSRGYVLHVCTWRIRSGPEEMTWSVFWKLTKSDESDARRRLYGIHIARNVNSIGSSIGSALEVTTAPRVLWCVPKHLPRLPGINYQFHVVCALIRCLGTSSIVSGNPFSRGWQRIYIFLLSAIVLLCDSSASFTTLTQLRNNDMPYVM